MSFQPQPREKNVLDGTNFRLYTPCPTPSGQGKTSQLLFAAFNGNPRIIVRTNDPADENNDHGRIQVKLAPPDFAVIMEAVIEASNQTGEWSAGFNITGFVGKPARPELTHRVVVGRDAEGYVFIVCRDLIKRERPVIKFNFSDNRNQRMVDREGNGLSPEKLSPITARAWAKLLIATTTQICVATWKEPENQRNGGGQRGGNGGGYNGGGNRNGGGGGYNGGNNNGGGYGGNGGGNSYGGGDSGGADTGSSDMSDDVPY